MRCDDEASGLRRTINLRNMKKLLTILLLYLAVASSVPRKEWNRQNSQRNRLDSAKEVIQASNFLGFSLLNKIPHGSNIFLSPISISMAMGMVYLGARNRTASEMARILGYESARLGPEDVPVGHKQMMDSILRLTENGNKKYSMEIANALLVDRTFDIKSDYKDKAKHYYDAVVESVNFASQPQVALESINGWTSWKTHKKIPEVLHEPLDPLTKLFLLNAIYFKGTWKIKFDRRLTMPDTFYNEGRTPVTVPMMRQRKKFNYSFSESLQCHALELPYDGDDITMLILLPEKRDGLPKLQSMLTKRVVDDIPNSLREGIVQVTLPQFTLEEEYDMVAILKDMGLRSLFNPNYADLGGISPQKLLHVNKIVHKSVIDVNEEGSEAATITGVAAGVRTGGPRHPTFTADHPFLFFIKEARTNALLFIGRVNSL